MKDMPSRNGIKERVKRFVTNPQKIFFYIKRYAKRHIKMFREDRAYNKQ
jgi:hypothetical protein